MKAFHKISLNLVLLFFLVFWAINVSALPIFARQTGQSCVACHAGGQFPELTQYGRLFKLTGYTVGERTIPVSGMFQGTVKKAKNNYDSGGQLDPNDAKFVANTASLFLAGRVTDNVGLFSQFTSNPSTGSATSDNFDLRYSDRTVDSRREFIWGTTLHNNPSVQDVWNTATAWQLPAVMGTSLPINTMLDGTLAQKVAGLGAYFYLNQHWYSELTLYRPANNAFKFLSLGYETGVPNSQNTLTVIDGYAPYVRVAYTHDWGPHNLMVGAFGMDARIMQNDPVTNIPMYGTSTHYLDRGIDTQYQYILAPHTFSIHARYISELIDDKYNNILADNSSGRLNSIFLRGSYVYLNKYGVNLTYRTISGSADSNYGTNLVSVGSPGSLSNTPNSALITPEIFWQPVQNVRLAMQYNFFTQYYGGSTYLDSGGAVRNASDNNSLFAYLWVAF